MTSAVALALMAKASAVFGGDGSYLSFPLTPLSFTKEQLDFLNDAANPAAALENASQFAHIVNQIPSGPVWPIADTGPLWDEYARILKFAELANEQRTPAEDAQYQTAMAFLYVSGPEGLRTSSPAVLAYDQYRDAYLNAKQQYGSRKVAAVASSDPAVKALWAADGPGLAQAVNAALAAWQTTGFKGQVDDARRIEQSLGAKSPAITWSQWSSACDPDVVAETDLENRHFMPTAFAPSSAIDSTVWQQFTLASSEIGQLVGQAPKELAAHLGTDQQIDIASIDFECTSVTIIRPWFAPDLFQARFWKLNSAPTVVSDGGSPAHGTIPGYTVAIVFARNLEVKLSATSQSAAPEAGAQLAIGPLHAATVVDTTGNRLFLRPLATVSPSVMMRPMFRPAAASLGAPAAIGMRPMMRMVATPVGRATVAPVAPAEPVAPSANLVRLRMMNFQRIDVPSAQTPASATPAQPQAQPSEPQSGADIFVLGFICKSVPLSPNPDPALSW